MGRDPCPVFLKGKGLSVCIDVCCVSLFAAFFQFSAFFLVRRIKRAAEAQAEAHADAEPCRGALKRDAEARAERNAEAQSDRQIGRRRLFSFS